MSIISITQLLSLNQEIKNQQLPYKIHLNDACGRQSFWIEELEPSTDLSLYDLLYQVLGQFFQKERIIIKFSEDKKVFWSVKN